MVRQVEPAQPDVIYVPAYNPVEVYGPWPYPYYPPYYWPPYSYYYPGYYPGAAFAAGVFWVGVWFVLGIIWFALVGQNRLVMAPEEAFAVDASRR